ncbi:MAG: sulfotransferase [Leptolyngbya sp. SIO4C1]|nr:sulfotransferase [Leptolyngbya sp. SIO4C1]
MTTGRLSPLRQQLRDRKNDWVQQYFKARIESVRDPFRVALRPAPYRFLLILSHMRSGSSLLSHLISANPEIIGYGETHLEYAEAADFKRLLENLYWHAQEFRTLSDWQKLRMHHRYAMDKVLHNKKFLTDSWLTSASVYAIFLLRQPARSLASIADLKPDWDESKTLTYYTERLTKLVDYAQLIDSPQRTLLLTYEQLLNDTAAALSTLQQFLQTQASFSENYQLLKTTGMKGVGDSKGSIKAGKIVRSQRQLTHRVAPDALARAQASYDSTTERLSQLCSTIDSFS